jgi:acyl-CoA reductase LuxC
MSEYLHFFEASGHRTAVVLPFELEELLAEWAALRTRMIRRISPDFTREEWGYLVAFLDPENLRSAFVQAFGMPCERSSGRANALARPRGSIALWLPNNVSLLGPLTVILLSLTGSHIRVKGGSRSEDLVGAFLRYLREHAQAGILTEYLDAYVTHEVFGRDDPRNAELAAHANMRVVFGSDRAAAAVHALPHPLASVGFSFSDRRSEVWVETDALTDEVLSALIKVFAVYGQAGCTSPGRVVVLDRPQADAVALRDRLCALWPHTLSRPIAPHLASQNVMARQWAAALGWDAALAAGHHAVLAAGGYEFPPIPAPLLLPIVAAPLEEAIACLPPNVQTVGRAVLEPDAPKWLSVLARTKIKRFVPIERMHHFSSVWDGERFWQQAFEMVQIGAER